MLSGRTIAVVHWGSFLARLLPQIVAHDVTKLNSNFECIPSDFNIIESRMVLKIE